MSSDNTPSNVRMEKSLPSAFYLSEEIYAKEKEKIFCSEWFCAAREEAVANPGDYLVLDVAGESVLLVRAKDGKLYAHYNVCRHRGARLCAAPDEILFPGEPQLSGGVLGTTGIRCPYHQWTYGLDGKLQNAPYLREEAGFCKSDFSLYPVGVSEWGGFVFLNLSPQSGNPGESLFAQLGEAVDRVKRYPLRDLRSAHRISYDVFANWKVILENYNECYHCGGVHPELCEVVPAFRQNGGANLEWERGVPHREGAHTFTATGTTSRAPFPGLNEDEKVRHKGELIYPNFMLSLASDHATAFTLWPQGTDRTKVICDFLFHPEEIAKPGFDPTDAVDFWDVVNRQDWEICKRVQQGMGSRVHKSGYYAPMEDLSLDIRNYIQKKLGSISE